MKVVTRIQLSTLPAVLGLFTVALLAYFGEYQRQAPELLVTLVLVAVVGTSTLAWHNARVLVRRVRALAAGFRSLGLLAPNRTMSGDEFDELDAVRDRVSELARSEELLRVTSAHRVSAAEQRLAQNEALLHAVAATVQQQLEEARLALHILQTSPFGELNENQEELVASARVASDMANEELQLLARLVAVLPGASVAARDVRSLRAFIDPPLAMALGGQDAVRTAARVLLPADLPSVVLHLTSANEALATLLRHAADTLPSSERLLLEATTTGDEVVVRVSPFPVPAEPMALRLSLAHRLLEAQGIISRYEDNALILTFTAAQ